MMVRHAVKVQCQCGLMLYSGHANAARHIESAYHLHAERIKALLAANCLSFAEIGKRIGVSRERVRQIAKKLGCETGRKRHRVCVLARDTESALSVPVISHLRMDCPFSVELLPRVRGGFWKHMVVVLGKRCQLTRAWRGASGQFRISVRRRKQSDFCLVDFTSFGLGWMILPGHRAKPTSFILRDPRIAIGTHDHHDYRTFLNKWELLRA